MLDLETLLAASERLAAGDLPGAIALVEAPRRHRPYPNAETCPICGGRAEPHLAIADERVFGDERVCLPCFDWAFGFDDWRGLVGDGAALSPLGELCARGFVTSSPPRATSPA